MVDKFYASGFFNLEDRYDKIRITDQPSAEISITINGKTKSVYDYHGTFDSPELEKLRVLENSIDEITNSSQWAGSSGEKMHSNLNFYSIDITFLKFMIHYNSR